MAVDNSRTGPLFQGQQKGNDMTTQTKQEAFDLFETHRSEWLAKARVEARNIADRHGSVTINEVRAAVPIPSGVDPRVAGAVFRGGDWVCLGYVSSARRTSHGRPVARFALA